MNQLQRKMDIDAFGSCRTARPAITALCRNLATEVEAQEHPN